MTDAWGPDGRGPDVESDRAGGLPPPPPPPPGGAALELEDLEAAVTPGTGPAPVRRSGGTERIVAALCGVVLLAGGAAFAFTQMGSDGPSSPEEAVDELLVAASNEDVLGALAALEPGERDAMAGPIADLFEELERLEVVDGLDLNGIAGLDISFDDVTYRVEEVRDGLARVYLTGGTVTTGVVTDELPIGDFVTDTLERFDVDFAGVRESETSEVAENEEVFVVARRGGDGWRVSIGYTAAEHAREDAGLLLEGLAPIVPVGAESPEAAVRGIAEAAADLDLRGVIARLSPAEMGALQDYAGLFLPEADAAIEDADDIDIELRDLTLEPQGSGDRVSVVVSGIDLSLTIDGSTIGVLVDGDCVTFSGDLDDFEGTPFAGAPGEPFCGDDIGAVYEEMFAGSGIEGLEDRLAELPPVDQPDLGITTVRIDGQWYVAPIASGFDAAVTSLSAIERAHLDALVEVFEALMESLSTGFEEVGTGEPLTSDPDVPTTIVDPLGGSADLTALDELVMLVTGGDPQLADCLGAQLRSLDPELLAELVDSFQRDFEPSAEVQAAFFDAMGACEGG